MAFCMSALTESIASVAATPRAAQQCETAPKRVCAAKSSAFCGQSVVTFSKSGVNSKARAAVVPMASISMPEGMAIEKKGADIWNTTYYPKGEDCDNTKKPWVIIDAEGMVLGRLATMISMYVRGGNTPAYTPAVDMGCYVVVINAEKVKVTGNKAEQKLYRRHTTGRPGKLKTENFSHLQARIPERIIEKAVKGMLPKNRMGRALFTHLKVYAGSEHPHSAQFPTDVTEDYKLNVPN